MHRGRTDEGQRGQRQQQVRADRHEHERAGEQQQPGRVRRSDVRPHHHSSGAASAPNPSTPVASPKPRAPAPVARGSRVSPTAASTPLSSATVPIARGTPGLRRAVRRTTGPTTTARRSRAPAGRRRHQTSATSVSTTAVAGRNGRVAGASSSPPTAGPTTNDATSMVTSRSVARRGRRRRRRASPRRAPGRPACRSDGGGGRQHGEQQPVLRHGDRRPGQQHRAGDERDPHDPVAPEPVGERAGGPGQRDVRQHPGRAGQPEQQVTAGASPPVVTSTSSSGQGSDIATAASAWLTSSRWTASHQPGPTSRVASGAKPLKPDRRVAGGVGAGREQPDGVALGERQRQLHRHLLVEHVRAVAGRPGEHARPGRPRRRRWSAAGSGSPRPASRPGR